MNLVVEAIQLDAITSGICVVLCCVLIFLGRPEIPLGIYLSMLGWTRGVQIGSVAHTYVLLVTIFLSAVTALYKENKISHVPTRHRWIIAWVITWWLWMYLLMILFGPFFIDGEQARLMKMLLFMVVLPMSILLLLPMDLGRLKLFAVSYVSTAIVGGWVALLLLTVPMEKVISDPTLVKSGIVRLGLVNYHWFSYPLAISLIFTLAFFAESRKAIGKFFLLVIGANLVYFLILAGSRQSILGVALACIIFFLWMRFRRRSSLILSIMFVLMIGGIVYFLVDSSPTLLRSKTLDSEGFATALDVRESRQSYWIGGLQLFAESPIWGFGFSKHYFSHNFFIGTLADQGLVGMTFLLGMLYFWVQQSKHVWSGLGDSHLDVYRMALFCTTVFALLYSQASGSPISVWNFWWSIGLQWKLSQTSQTSSRRLSKVARNAQMTQPVGEVLHG